MSQLNINNKRSRTRFGAETTFGSTPSSMYDAFPNSDSVDLSGLTGNKEIENEDESTRLNDAKVTLQGMFDGQVKFDYQVRAHAQQLSASVTPIVHPLGILLKTVMGGESVFSGSNVTNAPTSASITVPTNHGVRFPVGQWIGVQTSAGIEPTKVVSASGDTLSIYPYLSANPTSGNLVINSHTYYPTELNANSMNIQHVLIDDSSVQWTMSGCVGELELKSDANDKIQLTATMKVAAATGPIAQGLATSNVTSSMTVPFVMKDATHLLQTTATSTRTHSPVLSWGIKWTFGNDFIPDVGSTEGKVAPFRGGPRELGQVTVKCRIDPTLDTTNWSGQSTMYECLMVPLWGTTGSAKRWLVIETPTGQLLGKPKKNKESSGLVSMEATVRMRVDTTIADATAVTDLAKAACRIAII